MLLLFVGYYADVNFFSHSHIINGVTIVHSHLHNHHHHDTTGGGHTLTEITLIAQLANQFIATRETPQTCLAAADILLQTLGTEQAAKAIPPHISCPSLRAPPVA